MVKKRATRKLWDYFVSWVSDVISMTHSSETCVNGEIHLTNVTGKTLDIYEYLEFDFYEKVWFKYNAGLFPSEPGRWFSISHRTGSLMCFHILTETGKFISRIMVRRVTNIELSTDELK